MSLLNLTGEDADPVKALVFRELRDASIRRKEEEKMQSKEEEAVIRYTTTSACKFKIQIV